MRGRRPTGIALLAALALAPAAIVPVALADTVVLPPSSSPPWADPAHRSPLEQLSSKIASKVAERKVRVRCDTPSAWSALLRAEQLPDSVAGITTGATIDPHTKTFVRSANLARLAPWICRNLQQFAEASVKPTTCSGAPCFGQQGVIPEGGWARYRDIVFSIQALAHESIHLFDARAGRRSDLPREKRAYCFGIQWTPWVAEQLGASSEDGRAMAEYLYERVYPAYRDTGYWSAQCREGGSLDLTPRDGVWP